MTALYLIRLRLDIDALARWAAERGWAGGGHAYDEGRVLHHLVDEVFGPAVLRPFRLLVAPRQAGASLYAYSALDALRLAEAGGMHARPDHLAVLRLERLEDKRMPEHWRAGRRVGFDLRVRPTRRLRAPLVTAAGSIARGAEIDAFQWEALRSHPDCRGGMRGAGRSREAVYLDWLAERLAPAAELDGAQSRLHRFERNRIVRGATGIEGPDAVIHGTLAVREPDAFRLLLAQGVGRHRAFGYGMLLLTPPRGPAER